jgi:hypothetical protein
VAAAAADRLSAVMARALRHMLKQLYNGRQPWWVCDGVLVLLVLSMLPVTVNGLPVLSGTVQSSLERMLLVRLPKRMRACLSGSKLVYVPGC